MPETTTPTEEEPRIAQRSPFKVDLMATYRYAWCACGLSKSQPFCDGSHTATRTGITPRVWTHAADQTVFLCGCKRTKNPPYCDGSHNRL